MTRFPFYIRLITHENDKDLLDMFRSVVETTGPVNILNTVRVSDRMGYPHDINCQHYTDEDVHIYEVSLVRNLVESEGEKIVKMWDLIMEEDFIIETSTPYPETTIETEYESKVANSFNRLTDKIAKEEHNKWKDKKIKEGWRYALDYSEKDKTHPLLKDWDHLPSEYKKL